MSNFVKYLAAIQSGDTAGLPAPKTNIEFYLAKALGVYDGPLPSPKSVADVYLYTIAEQGIGGGGGDLPALTNPATAAKILAGYEAINANGAKLTGTMKNQGVLGDLLTPGDGDSYNLEEGYYAGGALSIATEEITVTPTSEEQVIEAENGYITKVTVEAAAGGGGGDFEINDASYLFYGGARTDIKDVLIPRIKNCTSMKNMFADCDALLDVDLSTLDTSLVENMNRVFYNCKKLSSLDVSHFNTSQVYTMEGLFLNCKVLTELNVSNFDTGKVQNMTQMFSSCECLETLDLSNFDTTKVNAMSSMFSGCSNLKSIIGFSAMNSALYTNGLPYGTASAPLALKRLTFRTDLPEGTYSIQSAIKIPYCSFERSGMVEMFNTLPDRSGLGSKAITITGNPCIVGGTGTVAAGTYEGTVADVEAFVNDNHLAGVELEVNMDGMAVAVPASELVFYLENNGLAADDVVTFDYPDVEFEYETLTDEDRAIATNKGWTLVE